MKGFKRLLEPGLEQEVLLFGILAGVCVWIAAFVL